MNTQVGYFEFFGVGGLNSEERSDPIPELRTARNKMKENERKLCNEITIRPEKKFSSLFDTNQKDMDGIRGPGPVPVDLFASNCNCIAQLGLDERRWKVFFPPTGPLAALPLNLLAG